ncbi:16370_t:CDS:2 [Dentiscutata erythropus]|uniref:16370_t:CDS:1 n=1 Tax=Dentiscutata erythropus TaxID=1348616 RepID=A0A9N9DDQ0_9GLOM|nr:16370_t:CDS:2 [Dentiscutata erythropus]
MVKVTVTLYAIIVILILLPSPSTQLKQFTYEDPQAGLDLLDDSKYSDGTIILRFGNPMKQVNGSTTCWDNTIYLRIIYPNASISFLSISNHGIPDFNFCLNNETETDYMTTTWGFDQKFMLTFYNSSNVTTSAIMGLFINFEGKILSTVKLHDALIDDGGIQGYWFVIPNSSSNDGFLFYCRGATVISWVHFSAPNKNGKIIEIANEIVQTNIKIVTTSAFYMLEKGFAIAYGGDDSTANTSIGTTNGVYIIFYYFEMGTRTGLSLLYQTPTRILKSKKNNTYQTLTLKRIICRVDFSGAGNIWNMKNISNDDYSIQPLQFGGYLMIVTSEENLLYGRILDENGDFYGNWSLPQPLNDPIHKSTYVLLTNDSIIAVENQNNSIWKVTCDNSTKLTGQDYKFNNPIISSTKPALGSRVNESTNQLYLSFTYPVILSTSNISIYQRINGGKDDLLRQKFQGDSPNKFCRIDPNDNKTVIIDVLPSTFNEPNSHYYVVIEDNFVKRSDSNEALLGIDKNLWTLVTSFSIKFNFNYTLDQITGIIRLTPDGSSYYLSLSSDDQQNFNKQMATDLSYIIPVDVNRFTPINGFEEDMSTGTLQILLFFNIKDTTDLSKKSASNITQDFNTLLKYKNYNALMNYNTTLLIDENCPMTIARNIIFERSFGADYNYHCCVSGLGYTIFFSFVEI